MPKFLEAKLKAECWAAGLFEGEGSVSARYVAVTQKDLWCLFKLKEWFGGTVGNTREDGTSQWWICGPNGREFVRNIYPHLSPRRQAQLDRIFFTDKRLQERKLAHKIHCVKRTTSRNRDEKGRFYASILRKEVEGGIRVQ